VYENPDILMNDKLIYLIFLLDYPASKVVQGPTLTDDAAVTLLQERFGDKQVIISAHMDELIKLPDSTVDCPSSLRNLYDCVTIHVRGLTSLRVDLECYGAFVIPIIMPKLPNEVKLMMVWKHPGQVWKIQELLATVQAEVVVRKATHISQTSSHKHIPLSVLYITQPIPYILVANHQNVEVITTLPCALLSQE